MTDLIQPPNTEAGRVASELRARLAGDDLPPTFAKLYSQHVKLRARQPGLSGWGRDESSLRLRDAIRILEAGFAERQSGGERWRDSVRRAGEILEWLSHPDLNSENLPTRLLAAAAYQIASYPARSFGLLNEEEYANESDILRTLLKADFVNLLTLLAQYWQSANPQQAAQEFQWAQNELLSRQLQEWVVNKVASALGVLCAAMRWGDETRLDSATIMLSETADFMLYGEDSYSWLLASLCSEVVNQYSKDTMRRHVDDIFKRVDQEGHEALERYLRQGYLTGRTLAWTSQVRGIERILTRESFVLCTPTGSGKTTIAELAILESLFPAEIQLGSGESDLVKSTPLVIYLVPPFVPG